MTEAQLALKFISYFSEGYDIYKEVPCCGGYIDIVAINHPISICVEVKPSLNFTVLEQAVRNIPYCNYSYVGVPNCAGRHFSYSVCRKFGVGVLIYDHIVKEIVKPAFLRNKNNEFYSDIKTRVKDYMKRSEAGSQHNRVTAFSNTVDSIERYLKRTGGRAKIGEVLESVDIHYSSLSCAKSSLSKWCRNGVIKNFEIEKGFFVLKETS